MKPIHILSSIFMCVFVMFLSCKETAKQPTDVINGTYNSVGYGRFLKISEGTFKVYDINKNLCIPLLEGSLSEVEDAITYKNDTLFLKDGINNYLYIKTEKVPDLCTEGTAAYTSAMKNKDNPVYNFEALWDDFKTHYAYFKLRNVHPDSMYAKYRPRINENTTAPELFLVLEEMLTSFNDGHISIDAPEDVMDAAASLKKENLETTETSKTIKKERLRNYQVSKKVADYYIPNGTSIKNGNLRWDIIKDNVGYLQVNQMMGVSDYELSDTLSFREYWMAYLELADKSKDDNKDEIEGINASLDTIMVALKDTEALIIDVRFNGGGKDEVGMAILERLNPKEFIAFTKKGKVGDHFTPINTVRQAARTDSYNKPIYLLISVESASATEIMALSSLSMPQITRIGSTTEGVFSDVMDRKLPNGWEYGLSSEVYLDTNGTNYESVGIPPDIEIGYSRDTQEFLYKVVDDLAADGDKAIETALRLAKAQ